MWLFLRCVLPCQRVHDFVIHHLVKDAQNGWYRYDTQFAVPILNTKKAIDHYTVYGGTLLIRNDADGKSYLYDLLDVEKKKVISKTSFSAETHSEVTSPKPSDTSILTDGENVKPKFSLKAYSEAEKKGHVKSAKEFFGETNNWNETGYITTDGTKLTSPADMRAHPAGKLGEGATIVICYLIGMIVFQSTPPARGATILHALRQQCRLISIHAPVRGATRKAGQELVQYLFQSTPPARGATTATAP